MSLIVSGPHFVYTVTPHTGRPGPDTDACLYCLMADLTSPDSLDSLAASQPPICVYRDVIYGHLN